MIKIDVPGFGLLSLKFLILDYNGTIAFDGHLKDEILPLLRQLREKLEIHVVTADTFGTVAESLQDFDLKIVTVPHEYQDEAKFEWLKGVGEEFVVAIGNGRNDGKMLKEAALGLLVMNEEGASAKTLKNADILCRSIEEALGLLLHPNRIIATLRN